MSHASPPRPYLLFSPHRGLRYTAQRILASAGPVHTASSWNVFRRRASESLCAVAVIRLDDRDDQDAAELGRLRTAAPLIPLVVVTREDPEALRTLASVPIDEVVWLDEMPDGLEEAARLATERAWRRRMHWAFELSPDVPRSLRDALTLASGADVPFLTVSELALVVGVDRRTLWRNWRQVTGTRGARGLKEVLAWLALVRAARLRRGGVSWTNVAERLGLNREVLRRTARRLMDTDLRGLDRAGIGVVFERFERRVLTPLRHRAMRDRSS